MTGKNMLTAMGARSVGRRSRRSIGAWFISILFVLVAVVSSAAEEGPLAPITPRELQEVFPDAQQVGPFEGTPPAAPVYQDGRVAGYAVSTLAAVRTTGYSGKPLDVLFGINLDGVITGALLRQHTEPILVIGVSETQLTAYVAGFRGISVKAEAAAVDSAAASFPAVVAGATVSSAVIRDGIMRAANAVALSRGILKGGGESGTLDPGTFEPASWEDLLADGSIVFRRFTEGDIAPAADPAGRGQDGDAGERLFIELYLSLLLPPRIGENLLGTLPFNRLLAEIDPGDQAIMIAANGRYSFKGTGFVRTGRFDRIQIVQEERTIPLTTEKYRNVEELAIDGAPGLREIGIFVIPEESGFDPLAPWRLDLMIAQASLGDGAETDVLSVDYRVPERYRLEPPAQQEAFDAQPLWQQTWGERWSSIAAVVLLLAGLTGILVFQDAFVRRRTLFRRLRWAFLLIVLVWLGWIAGGQLSVVNVLTFVHSLMTDFQWEFFLLDPLIFILWSYVAVALIFLGRGVFCGWLCPFGALQELLNAGARRLRVPQFRVPFALHERLWPIKYLAFLGLFAVSLNSMTTAFVGAEIEPFKTAISLRFQRDWPFVLYAAGLLMAGLFIERFFCRYLCPLGAALAIPARLRMFEWLKRHPQCGRECQICFHSCPVQAIHPEGPINPNECIHCLTCQMLYSDDTICPPLVARRKRRERRDELAAGRPVPARGGQP